MYQRLVCHLRLAVAYRFLNDSLISTLLEIPTAKFNFDTFLGSARFVLSSQNSAYETCVSINARASGLIGMLAMKSSVFCLAP